jgi:glycine/D-amino acid oxidase-like deaminating enzyme
VADPEAVELLASKVARAMPGLAHVPVRRSWAGLRTLTPDGNFVIGADAYIRGFIWCAGLGGHGVTASPAAGRLAAMSVMGRRPPPEHSPTRFGRSQSPPTGC